MGFLRRIFTRAAHELGNNPEARAQAKQVYEDDVKPFAKDAWQGAQPSIKRAKKGLLGFTLKVRDEYRKGRYGE